MEVAAMKRLLVCSAALVFATASVAIAADKLKSGIQPGKATEAYNVLDCTGPRVGIKYCLR